MKQPTPEDRRVAFARRALSEGTPMQRRPGKLLQRISYRPSAAARSGHCWANAWRHRALRYVEGVCLLHGTLQTHAWCLDRDGYVVEVTPGYALASHYHGFVLDRAAVRSELPAELRPPRGSVLEAIAAVEHVWITATAHMRRSEDANSV